MFIAIHYCIRMKHIVHTCAMLPLVFNSVSASQVDYKFMVHHYAGEIVYATEGFLEKNRDMLHQEGIDLLRSSSSEFIRSFGDR